MKANIKITGTEEITRTLKEAEKKVKDLTPVMREIGNYIKNVTEESFENQRTPWGEAWKPNAINVPGKQILIKSGQLQSSFTYDADNKSVTVGTKKKYAAIHQFGGEAGRNHSVDIPARPFMPIKNGALDKQVADAVIKKIQEYTAFESN